MVSNNVLDVAVNSLLPHIAPLVIATFFPCTEESENHWLIYLFGAGQGGATENVNSKIED